MLIFVGVIQYWPITAGGAIVVGPNGNLNVDKCQFINCQTRAIANTPTTPGCATCVNTYEGIYRYYI
jgi:hypothetical protein